MNLYLENLITEGILWETADVIVQIQFFFEDLVANCQHVEVPVHQTYRTIKDSEETIEKVVLDFLKSPDVAVSDFHPCGTIVQEVWQDGRIP